MARKSAAAPAAAKTARKGPARKRSAPRTSTRAKPKAAAGAMPGFGEMPKMPKMPKVMTPEQAIDLYKANAALALDVINTAIEGTARLRRKQFEGEEEAREFQKRHTRSAVEARDAQSLMMAGQGAAQEALEKSMHYWGEMFDLIVEIQKRLFSLMEEQMEDVPGVKESKAAMAMLPDLRQMQKVVSAMQGVVSSGGSAFETMQRVMGDFAKMAQGSMPGAQR
ncbi:MAG: phasin family protein [Casimicrobiaceae bacterium]